MKFDVARQPLVPAFLTLLVLTIVAMWGSGVAEYVPTVVEGLSVVPLDDLTARFQTAHPTLAAWIAGVLLIYGATATGRITIRYNLYTVGTCLPIPLCGVVIFSLACCENMLQCGVMVVLMALALKNFGRSFSTSYAFDALFRSSMYLSLLALVAPVATPLLLLIPIALQLFHRTHREAAVALAGALLPWFAVCYVNWAVGGSFATPLIHHGSGMVGGHWLALFDNMEMWRLATLAIFATLAMLASLIFFLNRYSANTRSRVVIAFCGYVAVLAIVVLATPAASTEALVLLAPPVAILLPALFIRISRTISAVLYLLLLAAGFAGAVL